MLVVFWWYLMDDFNFSIWIFSIISALYVCVFNSEINEIIKNGTNISLLKGKMQCGQ